MKSGDRSEMRQRGQRVTDGKQGDRGEEDVWKKKSNSRKEGVKEGCAQEEGGVWRKRENDVDVCLLFQL